MSDVNQTQPPAPVPAWRRAIPLPETMIVATITVICAAVSFYHEFELAFRNGQPRWAAALYPFTVDGLLALGSVTLLWAAANKIHRPWRPWAILLVGISATVAANLAADLTVWWFRPAVSAWTGAAVAIAGEMFVWLIRKRRELADPNAQQQGAGRRKTPPPLTLAEWASAAQVWLRDHGEPSGEQALADRIGTTRHQVRTALTPKTPELSVNGGGPHE